MIPYINGLLDKIQDAVLEFVEENEDDERIQTFGIDIHISVDDGNVFVPKVLKEKGGEE